MTEKGWHAGAGARQITQVHPAAQHSILQHVTAKTKTLGNGVDGDDRCVTNWLNATINNNDNVNIYNKPIRKYRRRVIPTCSSAYTFLYGR